MFKKITRTKKIASAAGSIVLFGVLAKLASLLKVSFIVGSWMASFSGVNMVTPLVGAWAGVTGSCGLFGFNLLLRLFLGGALSAQFLAYYVPGFCASLYWGSKSALIRLGLPILCMTLFALHPVGVNALPYALFGLIPICLFFVPRKVIFLESLGSTFVAHAVGSVIWLYTVPMSASTWLSLMPLVLIERLLFALGMTCLYYVFSWVAQQRRIMHVFRLRSKYVLYIMPALFICSGYTYTARFNSKGSSVITHFACIMDGNRRWAKQRGLAPWLGHREGIKAVERTVDFCLAHNIPHLSLYTFSIENFNRSTQEKNFLFNILADQVRDRILKMMIEKNVRIRFIGDHSLFPKNLVSALENMEAQTANNTALTVYPLFCYGGRQELTAAMKAIAQDVKSGRIEPDQITEQTIFDNLWLRGVPEPEIIVRTGGVQRLSNFLLYQAAYSELYFMDTLWPDVTDKELQKAVDYFDHCRRNFGR